MLVKQMFIFEEMTSVPYFPIEQHMGAFCARREETALFCTKMCA